MAIVITLDDPLAAELACRAEKESLSVEQIAIGILKAALQEATLSRPQESIPMNPARIRPASASLADVLRAAPSDSSFDLENWTRQWSGVEAELKALTHTNDVAEGRGA